MDIQTRKIHFVQEFLALSNEAIIYKLESILKKEILKEDNRRISIEQYNKELDEAEAEIDRGAFYTQSEVEKMAKEW